MAAGSLGRPGLWSAEQTARINQSLPRWHAFSLVENKDADGRDAMFTIWKKAEADKILEDKAFKILPTDVS
jgi:hypothetical protein